MIPIIYGPQKKCPALFEMCPVRSAIPWQMAEMWMWIYPQAVTIYPYLKSRQDTHRKPTCMSWLKRVCTAGTASSANQAEIRQRLEYELKIINRMGFETYFLIVWDLCRHAREKGIWYNARGSAAGSLVAYALDITLVEPIGHGLLFERFLNPDRKSMPDIDLDFQDDQRAQMMEYCAQKYGNDRVAQIITFGTMGAVDPSGM